MKQAFKAHIEKSFPELLDAPFIIALSGGRDSSVLTHLCHSLGLDFSLAHCNFHLRGLESDQDEQLCRELADSLGLQLTVKSFDVSSNDNIQLRTRKLRYNWFSSLIQESANKFVLTAHHLDDHIETFLMNMQRGSSLDGITGIPWKNDYILRPLLAFNRQQIADYTREHQVPYREDSSNLTDNYLRNRIRHHLTPVLKEVLPNFMDGFKRSQHYLREDLMLREGFLSRFRESVMTNTDSGETLIDLEKAGNYVQYDYLIFLYAKSLGFQRQQIDSILTAESGAKVFSETHTIWKNRNELILSTTAKEENHTTMVNGRGDFNWGSGVLNVSFQEVANPVAHVRAYAFPNTIFLDAEAIQFPMVLRSWREGDKLQPYGMAGSKLVSDIFIDRKLSPLEKKNTPILAEGNQVLWVVGQRSSRLHIVTEGTKKLCRITWKD